MQELYFPRVARADQMARPVLGLVFVIGALLALGGYRVFQARSSDTEPAPAQKPERDLFAADREPAAVESATFDAKRAMTYLEQICKIGPRISGTAGMKKQQELLKKHFATQGAKVELQQFTAK